MVDACGEAGILTVDEREDADVIIVLAVSITTAVIDELISWCAPRDAGDSGS